MGRRRTAVSGAPLPVLMGLSMTVRLFFFKFSNPNLTADDLSVSSHEPDTCVSDALRLL